LEAELAKEPQDSDLISDLRATLQYIKEDHGGQIDDFERLTSFGEITYDLLWALFVPNSLAYHFHEFTEQHQIFLVRSVQYLRRQDKSFYLSLDCDIITRDGKSSGFARDSSLEIDEFQGARKIQDLIVFPLKYHADASVIRDLAIRRGKKFIQMVGPTYHEISGPAMKEVMLLDNKEFNSKEVRRLKFSVRATFSSPDARLCHYRHTGGQ
jgi:hypothetical protein